jgi:hypothetical protein
MPARNSEQSVNKKAKTLNKPSTTPVEEETAGATHPFIPLSAQADSPLKGYLWNVKRLLRITL